MIAFRKTTVFKFVLSVCLIALQSGCSITSNLPEGEVLYTGVDRIDEINADSIDASVKDNVSLTLEVAPNSSFLGSAYRMSPFPVGLWIYNRFYTTEEKGLKHWIWNHFKSDPTLISQVNPELRSKAAKIKMEEEGFFNGTIVYDTVYSKKDHRKAKLAYKVIYPAQKNLHSITYINNKNARIDSILSHISDKTLLKQGERFSTANLEGEIERIVEALHDSGYFFYSADNIKYLADSTFTGNKIALRVITDNEADDKSLQPCRIDSIIYTIDWGYGLKKTDHDSIGFMRIDYNQNLNVKPHRLAEAIPLKKGELYNPYKINLTKTKLERLNTFRYTETNFQILDTKDEVLPTDTTSLILAITSTNNYPWSGTLEVDTKYKDNHQLGPGLSFVTQRRNCFHGGEVFQGEVNASYEWITGNSRKYIDNHNLMNSFEFGYKFSIIAPRLHLPSFIKIDTDKPVSTKYSISTEILRQSALFNLLRATAEVNYSFSSSKYSTHVFTPLKISYSSTLSATDDFYSMQKDFPSLIKTFEDQFIPQIGYSYIFDNSTSKNHVNNQHFLKVNISEAGCLLDAILGKVGRKRPQGERQFVFQKFSQFMKFSVDYRYYHTFRPKFVLAARAFAGTIYSFGNSDYAPFSEQFYIGGANSLRGFSIRGVGPGNFSYSDQKYAYLYRNGDIKFETNLEFRFPIVGDIHGALFADAGNVWLYDDAGFSSNEKVKLTKHGFAKQVATDAGIGLRYDLGMLVLRFDVGIPIHDPGEDNTKYYNPHGAFFGNLGYHLAVGYPF